MNAYYWKLSLVFLTAGSLNSCHTKQNTSTTSDQEEHVQHVPAQIHRPEFTFQPETSVETATTLDEPPRHQVRSFEALAGLLNRPASSHQINNFNDTLLVCPYGTKVVIPSNVFVNAIGQPAQYVDLVIKECYTVADMIADNVSTETHDHKLLETAGMIYISARDASGEVQLGPNKTIEIKFAGDQNLPLMQQFYGVHKQGEPIRWIAGQGALVDEERGRRPNFIDALTFRKTQRVLNLNTPFRQDFYSVKWQLRRGGNAIAYLTEQIRKVKVDNNAPVDRGSYKILVGFNNQGKVKDIDIQPQNAYLTAQVQPILMSMPHVRMESMGLTKIHKKFTLDLNVHEVELEMTEAEKQAEIRRRSEGLSDNQFDRSERQFIFRAAKLGWINCDRFYKTPQPKHELLVEAQGGRVSHAYLVFEKINAVMTAYLSGGKLRFTGVPEDQPVKLVAFTETNNAVKFSVEKCYTSSSNFNVRSWQALDSSSVQGLIARIER